MSTPRQESNVVRHSNRRSPEGRVPQRRHILVVVAPSSDPTLDGVVRAAQKSATQSLEGRGHRVSVVDLSGFAAALTTEERRAYSTATPLIDPITRRHAEIVCSCDGLVVIYASTLSTLPFVLKGWLDRTLVPGVSFVLDDSGHLHRGLTRLDNLVGIAVYGEDWRTTKRHRDAGRRIIMRNLRSCGRLGLRTAWLPLYMAQSADEGQITRFLRRIERRTAKL